MCQCGACVSLNLCVPVQRVCVSPHLPVQCGVCVPVSLRMCQCGACVPVNLCVPVQRVCVSPRLHSSPRLPVSAASVCQLASVCASAARVCQLTSVCACSAGVWLSSACVDYFNCFDFLPEIRLREDYVTPPELISTFSRIARHHIININVEISFRACGNFFRFFESKTEKFGVVGVNPTVL
jgi:hypothetical protein